MILKLGACVGNMNPTGGNGRLDYPYYIATQPMIVKKIPASNRYKTGI
jgi:hypothetical protein